MIARPVWLLEVNDRGGPRRYASRAVTVGGRAYRPGLAHFVLDINEELSEQGVEVTDPSVPDWRPRSGEAAVLSYYDEGTGELIDVLRGHVVSPEWADPSRPSTVAFTVAAKARATKLYPPSSERVTDETWVEPADEEAVSGGYDQQIAGAVYPTIIGYPGAGGSTSAHPVSPCLQVGAIEYGGVAGGGSTLGVSLIVSRGRIDASNVRVYDLSRNVQEQIGTTSGGDPVFADVEPPRKVNETKAVQEGTDHLGQLVSYVTLDPIYLFEELAPYAGNKFACTFKPTAGRGGGMVQGDEVMRGLGDVLLWMLTTAGVEVDYESQLGHLEDLNGSKVDAVISAADIDFARLVDSQLLTVFSLLRVQTPRGVFYRRKVTDPKARHAVRHLSTARREATRTSAIRGLFRQPETSFALEYGHNVVQGSHMRAVRAVPVAERDGDLVVESLRRTLAAYGENPGPTLQTSWVWSNSTAQRCVADMALLRGRQWLTTTYDLAELRGLWFGDVVTVTDDDPKADLQAQPAVVTNITLGGVRPVVSLTWPEAA